MATEVSTQQHIGTVNFIKWSGYHWRGYLSDKTGDDWIRIQGT